MCGVWLKFIKNQEPIGLLSNLGLKRPYRKIHLLGNILFQRYKINETVSNLLLAGNKFMLQIYYSTCGPFTKNKERINEFK